MIVIDETKLSNGIIELIGRAYGMEPQGREYYMEEYQEYLDEVVEKLNLKHYHIEKSKNKWYN